MSLNLNKTLLIIFALIVAYIPVAATQTQDNLNVEGAIQPYDKNPWYWEYKGKAIVMIGGSDDDNPFQWTGKKLTDQLDLLASLGGNYMRNCMSDVDEGNVYAFEEVEENVYDLDKWNREYWNRLHFFLEETSKRDIIVQLTLWNHYDIRGKHPWTHNVNLKPGVVENKTDFYGGAVYQNKEEVLAYQRRYIDKVLSVSLQFGNVLYNINNEGSELKEWDNYWASYIQQRAVEQGRNIYVTSMLFAPSSSMRHIMTFRDLYSYVDISQNNQDSQGGRGPAHYNNILYWRSILQGNPMPMNNVKIYGSGIGSNYSAGTQKEAIARFWRNIFAGCASSRFHRRSNREWGIGLGPAAQTNIKTMSMLLEGFDIFSASPNNELLSSYVRLSNTTMEAYCLADIGNQYAIYFPEGRYTIDLDPWVFVDELKVRWLDIEKSTWSPEETVSVDWDGGVKKWGYRARVRLTTPGNKPYVALLEVVE